MSPLPASSCALAFVPRCCFLALIVRCGHLLGVPGPGGRRFSLPLSSTLSSLVRGRQQSRPPLFGSGLCPSSYSSLRSSSVGAQGSLRSFSPFPSHRPSCILLLVVFILLLLASFKASESCSLSPWVGDCFSLLVLLEGHGLGSLCSGIFPSLSQDPIHFCWASPFSPMENSSQRVLLMGSGAVVLAPPCWLVLFEFIVAPYH